MSIASAIVVGCCMVAVAILASALHLARALRDSGTEVNVNTRVVDGLQGRSWN